ncbi:unnamed protein product [Moneuplotes crassus]|uniref:Uncharacterized protein n=2 Tax=Euplotes crassus TaxID=5936 RepID=A0AAD1UCP7_EUPCR|nr:unnamed protein product [Moneuplotes crassus]
MEQYVLDERDLTINPITGKPVIGRDLKKYAANSEISKLNQIERSDKKFYNKLRDYMSSEGKRKTNMGLSRLMHNRSLDLRDPNKIHQRSQSVQRNPMNTKAHDLYGTSNSLRNQDSPNFQDPNTRDRSFYQKFKSQHKNATMGSAYNDIKYTSSDFKARRNFETRDIEGAYPNRFKHKSKKLFVDRKEALSIFGQQPGEYHGFASDYVNGGTYQVDNDRGVLVKDLAKYAKYKMLQKEFQPKEYTDDSIPSPSKNIRNSSGSTQFRNSNKSHFQNFMKMNNKKPDRKVIETIPANSEPLLNSIEVPEQRKLMNKSFGRQNSQTNANFSPNSDFKPKSALKSPDSSYYSGMKNKNVSFDSGLNQNYSKSKINSSYLALRNKGYLTSDILGSNSMTADMIKVNYNGEAPRRPTFTKMGATIMPKVYRSGIPKYIGI